MNSLIKNTVIDKMSYKLVTPTGRVFTFYIEGCALLYKQIYGGEITTLTH